MRKALGMGREKKPREKLKPIVGVRKMNGVRSLRWPMRGGVKKWFGFKNTDKVVSFLCIRPLEDSLRHFSRQDVME